MSFPLRRYCPQISASLPQATMLCHSVRSCFSPLRSVKRSSVASVNLATLVPCGVDRISGSLPRRPIKMTLLMLAMLHSPSVLLIVMPPEGGRRSRADEWDFNPKRPRNAEILLAVDYASMKCVIQRVRRASVSVREEVVGEIGAGLLLL